MSILIVLFLFNCFHQKLELKGKALAAAAAKTSNLDKDKGKQQLLNKELFAAILRNNIKDIEKCLDNGANVNCTNLKGTRPLHNAIATASNKAIMKLIERGANVNTIDITGNTPLLLALKNKNTSIARSLINKGANVNAKDLENATPISLAVFYEFEDIVSILIKRGADLGACQQASSPLHIAIQIGNLRILEMLLKTGRADINAFDKFKYTPLMYACEEVKKYKVDISKIDEVLDLLLRYQPDLTVADKFGNTALHIAVFNERIIAVEKLIEAGSDLFALNGKSYIPINAAEIIENKKIEIMLEEKMMQKDAQKTEKFKKETKLIKAAKDENLLELARLIDEEKVDVNATDNNGLTSLHWAVHRKNTLLIAKLLERNARIDIQNQNGSTPLHVISILGDVSVAKQLLNASVNVVIDVNVVDNFHLSPLSYALANDHLELAYELLIRGAQTNMCNGNDEYLNKLLKCVALFNDVDMFQKILQIRQTAKFRWKEDVLQQQTNTSYLMTVKSICESY